MESGSRPGTLYHVSAGNCSCPAGERGLICKHRACYLFQIGELPIETAVEELATRPCMWCFGSGRVPNDHLQGFVACDMCGGCGDLVIQPQAAPEVQPAAAVA